MDEKSPSTLSECVAKSLRRDILDCKFMPGDKLLISQLKERYEIGSSPIREALCRLEASGYVLSEPQRGFSVANVSLEELEGMYETRVHIDNLTLELAIEYGGETWEANMISTFHLLKCFEETCGQKPDICEWQNRKMAFYDALMSGCPLQDLQDIFHRLLRKGERYRYIWFRKSANVQDLTESNKAFGKIVNAAIKRDKAKARKLLTTYIQDASVRMAEGLKSSGLVK